MKERKILIVDDNEGDRLLIKEALRKTGYEFFCATTGEECLEKVESEKPDVVLLDIRMPGMDGVTTCARLKSVYKVAAVIVVSGLDDPATRHDASLFGADGYIVKPVDAKDLKTEIEKALAKNRG